MVEKHIGFGPGAKPEKSEDGELVVANPLKLEEFKVLLKDALEKTKQREGSLRKEGDIDMINGLLSQIGMVEDIGRLLGVDLSTELVCPGSEEFKKTKKKRKLGFEVPEQDGSAQRIVP